MNRVLALFPGNIQFLLIDLYGDSKNLPQNIEIEEAVYESPIQPFGRRTQANKSPRFL